MKAWAAEIQQHIQAWSKRLGNLEWWPRYVYHFTDVRNAANILQQGFLYSRNEVERRGLMAVDNASPQVIGQTKPEHLDYVRLYFRPQTPTQYCNEGIRPVSQRQLGGAHCPIPIFFCFDAFQVLTHQETRFSNGNMGSPRCLHSDEQAFFFKNIPFEFVFHNRAFPRSMPQEERRTITFHKNAEVLIPQKLALDSALKFIACRSVAERQTLLQHLPLGLANRWQPRIRLGMSGLFERKWTFIEEVTTVDNRVIFHFNPDTTTSGPFTVKFTYQEDGEDRVRSWEGQKDKLTTKLSFDLTGARWGTATLHLDDALAFKGLILLEEIPF